MKPTLIVAALAGCLAASPAAWAAPEAPAATEPTPPAVSGAEPANPEPAKPEPAKPETMQQRQERSAAKLAGLIVFVANSCPEAQPDYDRFKQVITAMGVKVDDLSKGLLAVRSAEYTQAYQKEPAESCKRAFEHFGEGGKVIAGLIARRAPDAKGPEGKAPDAKAPDAKTPDARPAETPAPAETAPETTRP